MMTLNPSSTMAPIGCPRMRNRRPWLRGLALGLWLIFCTGCANRIFYQPQRSYAPSPDQRGHAYEAVAFTSTDGVMLTGWWLPAVGKAKGTVVHFHGNAHNMSGHVQYAEWLPAEGYNLFVFDYRGYGKSQGSPSRAGLVRDGMAALRLVHLRPDVDPQHLYVWGQSLGGNVALQAMLRSNVPVRAAIIDSTFSSHVQIATDKIKQMPWWLQPLRLFRPLLISGGYDADDAVKALPDLPIFFIHASGDPVIPASHSQALHALAPQNSKLWIINHPGHCDAVIRHAKDVQPRLLAFLGNAPAPVSK